MWCSGYAAALAPLERLFGQSTLVVEIMKADGITVDDLRKVGVGAFDLEAIVKAHGSKVGG